MKNILIVIAASLLLSGCAEMNSKFDCPMKQGVRCESLDRVNARVDHGEIGNDDIKSVNYSNSASNLKIKQNSLMNDVASNVPVRKEESVMRVWIAPFEDTSGNYHEASDVYTVIKAGYWAGNPVNTTNFDEE